MQAFLARGARPPDGFIPSRVGNDFKLWRPGSRFTGMPEERITVGGIPTLVNGMLYVNSCAVDFSQDLVVMTNRLMNGM